MKRRRTGKYAELKDALVFVAQASSADAEGLSLITCGDEANQNAPRKRLGLRRCCQVAAVRPQFKAEGSLQELQNNNALLCVRYVL